MGCSQGLQGLAQGPGKTGRLRHTAPSLTAVSSRPYRRNRAVGGGAGRPGPTVWARPLPSPWGVRGVGGWHPPPRMARLPPSTPPECGLWGGHRWWSRGAFSLGPPTGSLPAGAQAARAGERSCFWGRGRHCATPIKHSAFAVFLGAEFCLAVLPAEATFRLSAGGFRTRLTLLMPALTLLMPG
jgi:hypothetical protein